MRKPGEWLEGRCHSPVVHDSVGWEILCRSHLRTLKIGEVVRLLERKVVWEIRCQHPIERRRVEGLFRAHVGAVVDRNFVVLVEELIASDIVGGWSGGIYCSSSHGKKFVSWCDGREEWKTQVGWVT